jgi:hypothetical protein
MLGVLGRMVAASVLVLFTLSGTLAQERMRVRGTIVKVDGDMLDIKSREGNDLKVKLAPNAGVATVVKSSLGDIKPGSYIGVAALPQADGSQRAISVHIFAESMRGVAEGFQPWDLQPQSTMTNATVESTVSSVDGQNVMLKYKDGEKKITIPPSLQIVSLVPGTMADVKAGAGVFIGAAVKQPDGTLQAQRITVGKDVPPPM